MPLSQPMRKWRMSCDTSTRFTSRRSTKRAMEVSAKCVSRRRTRPFTRKRASATSHRRARSLTRRHKAKIIGAHFCAFAEIFFAIFVMSRLPLYLLVLLVSCTCIYAQAGDEKKAPAEEKSQVTIVLATGNSLLVDEVRESSDGYWYKRGNVTTLLDRERVIRIEHPKTEGEAKASAPAPTGKWTLA